MNIELQIHRVARHLWGHPVKLAGLVQLPELASCTFQRVLSYVEEFPISQISLFYLGAFVIAK